jgi:hypothetical protein
LKIKVLRFSYNMNPRLLTAVRKANHDHNFRKESGRNVTEESESVVNGFLLFIIMLYNPRHPPSITLRRDRQVRGLNNH